MKFSINIKRRHLFSPKPILALGLFCSAIIAPALASGAPVESVNVSPSFSKLRIDQGGNLYGLGPQQKSLFRIQVRKSGIATRRVLTWKHRITGFTTVESGFVITSNDSALMLDHAGKVLKTLGREKESDLLDRPVSVSGSGNHRMYVVEANDRVSVFGRDGVLLFRFGDTGERSERLKNAFDVYVDSTEHVYVLDERGKGRINIYSAAGNLVRSLNAESLQLAPFQAAQQLVPVISQSGEVLALAADGKTFIRYNWRSNSRQVVGQVSAPLVTAVAMGPNRLVAEDNSGIHAYPLGESIALTVPEPVLDNVTSNRVSAPKCSQAYMLPAKEVLCLNRKQGSLVKFSSGGKALVRYGGRLDAPSLLSWGRDRVAVSDESGITIFRHSGKLISHLENYRNPQAILVAGDRLLLIDNRKLVIINRDGIVIPADDTLQPSSFSRKTRFLAIDASQNLYTANRGGGRVNVFNLQSGRSYQVTREDISKIVGLRVDGNDQLYIFARHRDGGLYVHVYRGLTQRFIFRAGRELQAGGVSVAAASDSLLSIYNERDSSFRQFQYQQAPSKPVFLKITANAGHVALSWLHATEPYVYQYAVEAAVSEEGPFTKLDSTKNTQLDLRLTNKRFRFFRVSAVARSGITGPPSNIIENDFELPYQAFQAMNFPDAIDGLRKLTLQQPGNSAAHEYLVRSLLAVGQYDRALNVLNQMDDANDEPAPVNILRAQVLFRAGRYDQANDTLGQLKADTKLDSQQSRERATVCARVKLALDERREARTCLTRLLATQPEIFEARLLLLRSLNPNRDRAAIKSQLNWLSNNAGKKNDDERMNMLAGYFQDTGNYKSARQWYQRSLQVGTGNAQARAGLVQVAIAQKNFSKARSLALSFLRKPELQVEGYWLLGDVAMSEHRTGEAVLSYRKAATLDPSNRAVQLSLAHAYRMLKNYSQAEEALSAVLQFDPLNAQAHFELANIRIAEGDSQLAIRQLYAGLQRQPENTLAREKLAGLLKADGQLHAATMQALLLVRTSPSEKHIRGLADLYYEQGRYRPALEQYRDLLSKHRNSVELNTRLGAIYHRLGQDVLARKVLEKAVRLNRKAESAHTVLAQVYSDLGLFKSALRAANTAFKLDPGADNRLLVESIKTDRNAYLDRKRRGTSVVIDKLTLVPVYSTSLGDEKVSIGSLKISNPGAKAVSGCTLRVYVGDFVDSGSTFTIDTVKARSSTEVPLDIKLSSHADELIEDRAMRVVVELSYPDPRGSRIQEVDGLLRIFGRHAVDWESARSLGHFLSIPDHIAEQSQSGSGSEPVTAGLHPEFLAPVIRDYSLISELGVVLIPRAKSELRYLQYPVETLSRHQGSPADFTVLLAAKLVSEGRRVAISGTTENPVLLFDSKISWDQRASLELKDTQIIEYDGEAWIPLAMDRWRDGIVAMWREGSTRLTLPDKRATVTVPVPGPVSRAVTHEVEPTTRSQEQAWLQWFAQQQVYLLQEYQLKSTGQAGTGSALHQARWYLQKKYYRRAIQSFAAVLIENPYSFDAAVGVGEANDALGNRERALEFYNRASILEPFEISSRKKAFEVLKLLDRPSQAADMKRGIELLTTQKNPGT